MCCCVVDLKSQFRRQPERVPASVMAAAAAEESFLADAGAGGGGAVAEVAGAGGGVAAGGAAASEAFSNHSVVACIIHAVHVCTMIIILTYVFTRLFCHLNYDGPTTPILTHSNRTSTPIVSQTVRRRDKPWSDLSCHSPRSIIVFCLSIFPDDTHSRG